MLDLQPATFEEFERQTELGNVVPVVRSVLADLLTPVGAFMRLAAESSHAFLLESIEGGERIARYSFLGAKPEMIVQSRAEQTVIERNGQLEVLPVLATEWVREYFRERSLAQRAGLVPFAGGAVGYLTYDAASWFEPALKSEPASALPATQDPTPAPEAVWMFYRDVIAFDRLRQRMELVSVVLTEEANGSTGRLRELYEQAVARTERLERKLLKGVPRTKSGSRRVVRGAKSKTPKSSWTKSEFEAAVRTIQEYIRAGECYQVVLSQRFSTSFNGPPIEIYRALRTVNPSPYMFFLQLPQQSIIGASPEMLIRCHGQRLDYRPIAGTRKRGATETEDWLLAEDLKTDEKEVAEHMMLVDLGRNDLGRVADYGSVQVEELMTIERYSHVQHLVTTLRARLRDGLDRFHAFASCFPAGTVTGAPKIRAMQIISKLEPHARGIYAGSVFYLDYAGNLDSCITIRTIVVRDGEASVQAGAGIVADSVPEQEYVETLNKAYGMFRAIELAERGL